MKRHLTYVALLASFCAPAFAQSTFCTKHPDRCEKKVFVLTADEQKQWDYINTRIRTLSDLEDRAQEEKANLWNTIIAGHGMKDFPKSGEEYPRSRYDSEKPLLCSKAGRFSMVDNKFMIYTPDEDANRCVVGK